MQILSTVGRFFYGAAIAGMGIVTLYYKAFPYMLLPPNYAGIPGLLLIIYVAGTALLLAGICIAVLKMSRAAALILGAAFLLVFCLYHIPYEFLVSANYMHFGDWENAAKVLALSAGAWVIAGLAPKQEESPFFKFLAKLIPLGAILYSITIISFGVNHFLYAKEATGYMPGWVSNKLFWIYLAGAGLLGGGIAILLSIGVRLFAVLLGTMMLIWFIILHIPKVIAAAPADRGGEMTSAFLALAYSGIAYVVAGVARAAKNKTTRA